MLNKTKIICNIGPQSSDESTLEEMILSGMNVARLNFVNGDISVQQKYISTIRKLSLIHGRQISFMLDTYGPKIRVLSLENDMASIGKGSLVTISMKQDLHGNASLFAINYPMLINDVKKDDVLLVNAGALKLKVNKINKQTKRIECEALNSGNIYSNCLLNLVGHKSSVDILNSDDVVNLNFAIKTNLDYVAASFVRDASDVITIKSYLAEANANIKVLAKIENALAVENFDEILRVSDGIIIPRGDLSIEIELEKLPVIQKNIIRKCNEAGKVVIVGTQVLSSMTRNKLPSRAEVSDVANLVLDGVDGISLSNVTTVGNYPIRAVKQLNKILAVTENEFETLSHFSLLSSNYGHEKSFNESVAIAVKETAKVVNAKLIVAFSESGATAKRISKLRPNSAIISVSTNAEVRNELTLYWGIYPEVSTHPIFEADFVPMAREIAVYYGLKEGDTFVITGGNGVGNTNFMKVCKL